MVLKINDNKCEPISDCYCLINLSLFLVSHFMASFINLDLLLIVSCSALAVIYYSLYFIL